MSDISPAASKVTVMTASVVGEARSYVSALIGRQPPGAKLKQAFPRVARLVGMTERRVKAIWHGENKSINGDELEALRRAVVKVSGAQVVNETKSYADRIEAAAYALAAIDPDFHRPEIDRLRNVAAGVRNALRDQG
jgi:glycerol-3-phosphate O-acyltransferase